MDLAYLFRVLFKRKWLIFSAAVLAAAIAWFLTRNEKKNYRSSSRISTGFAVPDEIKLNDKDYSGYDAQLKFNNAITTWTSPSVISLLSYQLIIHDLKSPNGPFRHLTDAQKQSPTYKNIDTAQALTVFSRKLDSMVVLTSYKPEEKRLLEFLSLYGYDYTGLNQRISIFQVPNTDYIEIDCNSENPELSAFVVNNVFDQFIRYYRGIKSTTSQTAVDTLQSIMDKKKQDLDAKNLELRAIGGGGDADVENTAKFTTISELEKALSTEKNKQTDDRYSLQKVKTKIANISSGGTSSGDPNNNPELVIARKAMNDAYAEYLKTGDATILARYNQLKGEYQIKYANSKVNSNDNKSADNLASLQDQKNDLEVNIQASDTKINAIQSQISILKGSAQSLNARSADVETLKEEVKMMESEYFAAKAKYNAAYDMSSSAVNNFRQLQLAQPAIQPEPSKRKIIVMMAGVVTMLSSILIIVLLTYLDSSIKTPIIFSKMVNLKLISMVNFMNLKNKDLKELVAGRLKEETRDEKNRSNIFRESVRKLRYEIEKSGKKIFMFTSTKKGQGKTTLIQALSYSLSLSKKKVLIIDTNFCNNDLTVQLDANPVLEKIGDASKNGSTLTNQIKDLSKNVGDEGNIFVIGSEGGDYTPSEVLPRNNILQELHTLVPEFDFIFLEGPPLNDFSDSKELLQYVDGVVGIFSAKHIVKQIDKESIKFFKDMDGKFIGSVLNMVDLENVNVI